jgi:hypothetical protein
MINIISHRTMSMSSPIISSTTTAPATQTTFSALPIFVLHLVVDGLHDDIVGQPLDALTRLVHIISSPSAISAIIVVRIQIYSSLNLTSKSARVFLASTSECACIGTSPASSDARYTQTCGDLAAKRCTLAVRTRLRAVGVLASGMSELVGFADVDAHQTRLDIGKETLDRWNAGGNKRHGKHDLSPDCGHHGVPGAVRSLGVVVGVVGDKGTDGEGRCSRKC